MKVQIRRMVFETNSSSTHSLTMCTKEEYEGWKLGKLLHTPFAEKEFQPVEDVGEQPEGYDNGIFTYNQYAELSRYYEDFYGEYRSPSGDNIVAFGYYGTDY